jgi:hypothetical protein
MNNYRVPEPHAEKKGHICRGKLRAFPKRDDNFSPVRRYGFPEKTIGVPGEDDRGSRAGRQCFLARTVSFPGRDDKVRVGNFA